MLIEVLVHEAVVVESSHYTRFVVFQAAAASCDVQVFS